MREASRLHSLTALIAACRGAQITGNCEPASSVPFFARYPPSPSPRRGSAPAPAPPQPVAPPQGLRPQPLRRRLSMPRRRAVSLNGTLGLPLPLALALLALRLLALLALLCAVPALADGGSPLWLCPDGMHLQANASASGGAGAAPPASVPAVRCLFRWWARTVASAAPRASTTARGCASLANA